jgi:hypothetical protein
VRSLVVDRPGLPGPPRGLFVHQDDVTAQITDHGQGGHRQGDGRQGQQQQVRGQERDDPADGHRARDHDRRATAKVTGRASAAAGRIRLRT